MGDALSPCASSQWWIPSSGVHPRVHPTRSSRGNHGQAHRCDLLSYGGGVRLCVAVQLYENGPVWLSPISTGRLRASGTT